MEVDDLLCSRNARSVFRPLILHCEQGIYFWPRGGLSIAEKKYERSGTSRTN
jgi:hypothetical protein